MFNTNNLVSGLILGFMLPIAGWLMLSQIFALLELKGAASGAGFSENFRERTVVIVAIALNILPMRIFQKRRWEASIRGIGLATILLALVWVGIYGIKLF